MSIGAGCNHSDYPDASKLNNEPDLNVKVELLRAMLINRRPVIEYQETRFSWLAKSRSLSLQMSIDLGKVLTHWRANSGYWRHKLPIGLAERYQPMTLVFNVRCLSGTSWMSRALINTF